MAPRSSVCVHSDTPAGELSCSTTPARWPLLLPLLRVGPPGGPRGPHGRPTLNGCPGSLRAGFRGTGKLLPCVWPPDPASRRCQGRLESRHIHLGALKREGGAGRSSCQDGLVLHDSFIHDRSTMWLPGPGKGGRGHAAAAAAATCGNLILAVNQREGSKQHASPCTCSTGAAYLSSLG